MKPAAATVTASLLSLASPAMAQTDEQATYALKSVQYEASRCIAFYDITGQCFQNDNIPDVTVKMIKTPERLIELALKIGRSIGMTDAAMFSRIATEEREMLVLIESNCINHSSLVARYGARCKQLVEEGDSIFLEYLGEPQ
jgi:hypothetical protein